MHLVKTKSATAPRDDYVNLRGDVSTGVMRWDAHAAARTAHAFFRDNKIAVVRVFDSLKISSFICESAGHNAVKIMETGSVYRF